VEAFGLSAVRRRQLEPIPRDVLMEEATLPLLLETPLPGLGPPPPQWRLDATAVAA